MRLPPAVMDVVGTLSELPQSWLAEVALDVALSEHYRLTQAEAEWQDSSSRVYKGDARELTIRVLRAVQTSLEMQLVLMRALPTAIEAQLAELGSLENGVVWIDESDPDGGTHFGEPRVEGNTFELSSALNGYIEAVIDAVRDGAHGQDEIP